jgi:ubiquinone/menaquinone biosynthesis C-methylase UbiE/uncharacterized protein YbaR (Trm112 family)
MDLMDRSLKYLCCPGCRTSELERLDPGLRCVRCATEYPIKAGIVDFVPRYRAASGAAQQAMENPDIVEIYEDQWRPWFTSQGSTVTYQDEDAFLLERLTRGPVGCAIDLAPGTGRYARLLADSCAPEVVLALDISLPMLQKGHAMAREGGYESILFARSDAHALPVRDGAADMLNCFGALHLFETPARSIQELARVASAGAVLTCLTACRSSDPEEVKQQEEFSRRAGFHFFDVEELRALLHSVGFEAFDPEPVGSVLMFGARRAG